MKVIKFLSKRFAFDSTKEKVVGSLLSTIFIAAITWIINLVSDTGTVLKISALAVILLLFIIAKFYRPLFSNNKASLIMSFYIGIEMLWKFRPPESLFYGYSTFSIFLTAAALFVIFTFLPAFVFGSALSFLGGEPDTGIFKRTLPLCTGLFFTVYLFLPSETYFYNAMEIKYTYLDFAPYFLFKTAAFSLFSAFLLCQFKEKPRRFISDIMVGLIACIYVQYLFMNKSLPKVDGKAQWDSMHKQMVLNGVIWLTIMALPFTLDFFLSRSEKLREKHIPNKIRLAVPVFVGGIQLITLVTLMISNPSAIAEYNMVLLSGKDQFCVSPNKNIITIILDMADQNEYEEYYAKSPEEFAFLKDFTCYNNTAMMYDSTNLSIPSMLSAARIYPETHLPEWYDDICHDEPAQTFYRRLHDNNYQVKVFGDFMFDYSGFQGSFDNVVRVRRNDIVINRNELFTSVSTMSAYRFLPLFLKPLAEPSDDFGNDSVDIPLSSIIDNIEFLDQLKLKKYDSDKNAFIVQHLEGNHDGLSDRQQSIRNCLAILDKYLSQLKELGVYDDSLIIVTADHGYHTAADNMPIWYMKKPESTHDSMQFCDSPISLTDFAATCLDEAGLYTKDDEALLGRPVSQIGEEEERTRLVFQRPNFTHKGDVPAPPENYAYWLGYYYTGDKKELVKHEKNDPPDYLLLSGFTG